MSFKIATEQEVYDIGGTKPSDYIANRGITVGRVELFGCSIENSSECFVDLTNPNQLVPLELIKSQDSKYLKFTSNQDGSTVGYTITGTVNKDIYTSTDGINWTAWDGTSKTLNQGESFYVWNKVGSLSTSIPNYLKFTMSGSIAASGDISSMLNWATLGTYCYYRMFDDCTSLTTAPLLPATTLAPYCYRNMFDNCTSLTTAPSLPATTLAPYCYWSLFENCTSLTTAPALPATILAEHCYRNMFNRCTSLTTAPSLPATTLVENCYMYMFDVCPSLNYIKLSYTGAFNTNYFYNWVNNVAPTGAFYYNGSDKTRGVSAIPNGWTVRRF